MSVQKTPTPHSWHDSLERAAKLLPADPTAVLFHEERESVRIEIAGGTPEARILASKIHGVAARDGSGRVHHRSDPMPEDVAPLVAGLRDVVVPRVGMKGPQPEMGGAAVAVPNRERVVRTLIDTSRAMQRLGAGVIADLSIVWVEFVQRIWVARAGDPPRDDTRRGCRMRIRASANGWPRGATVEVDRLIQPDAIPGVDEMIEPLVRRLRQRLTARPAPAGNHPIVFSPGTGGMVVHELVGHSLEADTVGRDGSMLAGMRGSVSSEFVTVIDDPRRSRAPWRVDDDGMDATPVALMREGRVTGLLHDARSARAKQRSPTGHGRCAMYSAAVRPRMGCTFLAPGPHDPEEVVASTRSGIHVRRMEGAGTDPASGIAYFRVTDADRIEAGRIDAPLEPFLLRVTLTEGLASIDRVADDLEFDTCIGACVRDGQALATSVGAPTYRLGVATIVP